jgi:hypothetical protein
MDANEGAGNKSQKTIARRSHRFAQKETTKVFAEMIDPAAKVEAEAAWNTEIDRRVKEIQSGGARGVPAKVVSARIRKIVGR